MLINPFGGALDSCKLTRAILTVQFVPSCSLSLDQPVTNVRRSVRDQCDKCYAYSPRGSFRQVRALDMRLERTLRLVTICQS